MYWLILPSQWFFDIDFVIFPLSTMKPKLSALKFQIQVHQTTSSRTEWLLGFYHLNPALCPNPEPFCARGFWLALGLLLTRKRQMTSSVVDSGGEADRALRSSEPCWLDITFPYAFGTLSGHSFSSIVLSVYLWISTVLLVIDALYFTIW